jgi:hypothetical protein
MARLPARRVSAAKAFKVTPSLKTAQRTAPPGDVGPPSAFNDRSTRRRAAKAASPGIAPVPPGTRPRSAALSGSSRTALKVSSNLRPAAYSAAVIDPRRSSTVRVS